MKEKIYFVFVIFIITILLVIISGCGGLYKSGRPTLEDIEKGSDGLVLNFIENAPPSEIPQNTMIQIGLKVKNKGTTDVKRGYLLLGYESEYLNLHSWQNQGRGDRITINLDGKSQIIPQGEEEVYISNIEIKGIGMQREKAQTTVYATTCYDYKTTAHATVCIDTDPYNLKAIKKACSAADVSLGDQGAPIAIRKIEYSIAVSINQGLIKPQFKIYFSNVGGNTIISKGKAEIACSAQPLKKEDINMIKIDAVLSDTKLRCTPEILQISEISDYTTCTLENGIDEGQQSYNTPLTITAEYGYMQTISKTISIVK